MVETETIAAEGVATAEATSVPKRGKRYKLWKDGDYFVSQIAPPGGTFPAGSLLPIPDVPHFEGTKEAMKFIENSGDLLAGKQLMIGRGYEILKVEVEQQPKLTITKKPKTQVAGPETEDGG